jgi:hypothetical protein
VDTATGGVIATGNDEAAFLPVTAGGHYRCDFTNARATGGVWIWAAFEPDGRYDLDRGTHSDPGWTFDVTVRGGYPHHRLITTGDTNDGLLLWIAEGRRTAQVVVMGRLPEGYRYAEAGCLLENRRDKGINGYLGPPWDVAAHDGRIAISLDKWDVATCLFVIVPGSQTLPQTDTTSEILSPEPGHGRERIPGFGVEAPRLVVAAGALTALWIGCRTGRRRRRAVS